MVSGQNCRVGTIRPKHVEGFLVLTNEDVTPFGEKEKCKRGPCFPEGVLGHPVVGCQECGKQF